MFGNMMKKKVTIHFSRDNFDKLNRISKESKIPLVTLITRMVTLLIDMPDKASTMLENYCNLRIGELAAEMREHGPEIQKQLRAVTVGFQQFSLFCATKQTQTPHDGERGHKGSIDLDLDTYQLLQMHAAKAGLTVGKVINNLIPLVFMGDVQYRVEMAKYCLSEAENANGRDDDGSGAYFNKDKNDTRIFFQDLGELFRLGTDESRLRHRDWLKRKETMRRVEMADGFITVPADWIILDSVLDPSRAHHAIILECRNEQKYGVPHFLYFKEDRIEVTSEEKEKVFQECIRYYPRFKSILEEQRKLATATMAEWKELPEVGFFWAPADDDLFFDHHQYIPFGCYIRRYKREGGEVDGQNENGGAGD